MLTNFCQVSCSQGKKSWYLKIESIKFLSNNPGCRTGFGTNGTECYACPFASYKDVDDGAPCTPCGDNANTTGTNSTDQAHCCKYPPMELKSFFDSEANEDSKMICKHNLKFLPVCNPGYYESGGSCLECEIGTYKSELGDEACTPCGSLKTTNTSGNTDNSSCGEYN